MLWPALRILSIGELTSDQLTSLIDTLQLDEVPRTDGPGADMSIAHRSFTDATGSRLVLDLARVSDTGWALALFFDREKPSRDTIDDYRRKLRHAMERLGLRIIEVIPAATADEVFVTPPSPPGTPDSYIVRFWDLPYENLEQLWPHLGLLKDDPREVKEVRLREIMRSPAWPSAPPTLRAEAESFLRDS
jgi:hypothetical protein